MDAPGLAVDVADHAADDDRLPFLDPEPLGTRVVAVIAERLTVALAAMPQVCPKPESEGEAAC